MSDNKITQKEYWKEVTSLAKQIAEEARGGGDRHDILHETIDGHEWIIYTWAYPYVLIHSRNEDALFEQLGGQTTDSYSDIMQRMAFWALKEDVGNELAGIEEPEED
jgi:hypothetical protein